MWLEKRIRYEGIENINCKSSKKSIECHLYNRPDDSGTLALVNTDPIRVGRLKFWELMYCDMRTKGQINCDILNSYCEVLRTVDPVKGEPPFELSCEGEMDH